MTPLLKILQQLDKTQTLYVDVESDKLPSRKEYSVLILCSVYQAHWEKAIVVQFNETSYIPEDVTDPTVFWQVIKDCQLGGHNLGSDLHYFKKRVGDTFSVQRTYVDTMHLMRLAYPEWREKYKLSGAYGLAVGSARIYKELNLKSPYSGLDKKVLQQSFKYHTPPTEKQLEYAKLDVTVLPTLHKHMEKYIQSAPYQNLMGAMVATFSFRGLPLDEGFHSAFIANLKADMRPDSKSQEDSVYDAQLEEESLLNKWTVQGSLNPIFNVKSPNRVKEALGLTLNSDDQTLATIATREDGLEGLTLSKFKLAKEIKDRLKVNGKPRGLKLSTTLDTWLWTYYEKNYSGLLAECMQISLPCYDSRYVKTHILQEDVSFAILEECNVDLYLNFGVCEADNYIDTMEVKVFTTTAKLRIKFKKFEDIAECTISFTDYNIQAMIYSSLIYKVANDADIHRPKQEVIDIFNSYAPTTQDILDRLPPPITLLVEPYYTHSQYKKRLADVVREQRKIRTGLAFEKRINYYKKNGRISANTASSVAVTSRLQFSAENTSQYSRDIRAIWGVPQDSNRVLIYADFSQIELRSLTQLMGDRTLCKAFINGEDSHKATTSMIDSSLSRYALRMLEEQGVGRRPIGKEFNFGGLYGGGASMLQGRILKKLGVWLPLKEVETLLRNWRSLYSDIHRWQKINARKNRTSSLLGREFVYFDEYNNYTDKNNHQNQCSGTEISHSALAIMHKTIQLKDTFCVNYQYDSYLYETTIDQMEVVAHLMLTSMHRAYTEIAKKYGKYPDLPMPIEVTAGKNLGDIENNKNILYTLTSEG